MKLKADFVRDSLSESLDAQRIKDESHQKAVRTGTGSPYRVKFLPPVSADDSGSSSLFLGPAAVSVLRQGITPTKTSLSGYPEHVHSPSPSSTGATSPYTA